MSTYFSNSPYLYTFNTQLPPFIPPQAGGRVGGIGIIGVEILSHSVQIIVTFTIKGIYTESRRRLCENH